MVKKSKKPKAFVKYDWKEESRHIFSFAFVSFNRSFRSNDSTVNLMIGSYSSIRLRKVAFFYENFILRIRKSPLLNV